MELSPGGPGPDRAWKIHYIAIKNKQWVESDLWVCARNANEAEQKAYNKFGTHD